MKRRIYAVVLALVCLMCALCAAAQAENAAFRGFNKTDKYQYVIFGTYPQSKNGEVQPVLWRVLEAGDTHALLLAEYVLDARQVLDVTDKKVIEERTYRRITTIEESDIYVWMNETMASTLFTPAELAVLDDARGKVFLPTNEDYTNPAYGFSAGVYGEQPTRQCNCTDYAKAQGVYREGKSSSYWVNYVRGKLDYKLQIVGVNGHLSYGAYSRTNIGVRPAVLVQMNAVHFASGSGTKDDPYVVMVNDTSVPEVTALPAMEEAPEATATPEPVAEEAPVVTAEPTEAPAAEPAAKASEAPDGLNNPFAVQTEEGKLVLSFIGDCSIGDSYQYRKYESGYHAVVAEKGYEWPFSLVREFLDADDVTLANLEVVITTANAHSKNKYNLVADPAHVEILLNSGVDIFNTVNNHAFDFNTQGYRDTLAYLDAAGIRHFGTIYPTQERGSDIVTTMEVKGVKIGFIGFNYPNQGDEKRIADRISTLREEGCQLVIVSLHWGRETYATPTVGQVNLAKKIIDSGADVIWGHHAHVLQPVHFYKGKPIFYSTGNFTFGTMSKVDPNTGIFQLTYDLKEGAVDLTTFSVVPLQTQGSGDFRPVPLTEEEDIRKMLDRLVWKKSFKGITPLPADFDGSIEIRDGELVLE